MTQTNTGKLMQCPQIYKCWQADNITIYLLTVKTTRLFWHVATNTAINLLQLNVATAPVICRLMRILFINIQNENHTLAPFGSAQPIPKVLKWKGSSQTVEEKSYMRKVCYSWAVWVRIKQTNLTKKCFFRQGTW